MRRVATILARRMAVLPITVFVIVTSTFLLLRLLPGDPAVELAGSFASAEEVAAIRTELGLDASLWQQYVGYVGGLLQGDLGTSFFTQEPIWTTVRELLPLSLELILLAIAVTAVVGLVVGGIAAYYRGRRADLVARGIIIVQQSVPEFVLGLLLIFVLFYLLGWFPTPVGRVGIGQSAPPPVTHFFFVDSLLAGRWDLFVGGLHRAILPALSIGLLASAGVAKTTRATLGSALQSPQVEFARACGLSERKVLHYAFTTARTPILTYGALLLAGLIGGTVIIESIFSWNGFAQWGLESIYRLDFPAIQGFILVAGTGAVLVYVALDALVLILDPRVTYDA